MKKKSVTMSDIAKTMDISTVTVSKALSDKEGVGEELREKIKQKAIEMGYRLGSSSKAAKGGLTFNISIVIADHFINDTSAFYWVMYRNIVELLQRQSYYAILDVITENDVREKKLPGSVIGKKVDGVIVLGQFEIEYAKALSQLDLPTVFLDFYSSDNSTDTVLSDSFFGSYMLTNHLIENGHRRIAFLGSINATSSIEDRYLGYYKALLENNIPLNSELIIEDRGADGRGFLSFTLPSKMPTAFVCNCDEAAYILINQLKKEGYSVPDDVSVVGYDNHIYSTLSEPKITTIDVDSNRMSAEAVETIIKKIRNRNYSRGRTLVTGKIIYRDSVKAIKR